MVANANQTQRNCPVFAISASKLWIGVEIRPHDSFLINSLRRLSAPKQRADPQILATSCSSQASVLSARQSPQAEYVLWPVCYGAGPPATERMSVSGFVIEGMNPWCS